ncbi:DUF5592 family protein [Carnobacterium maltaromaticum]|uniref:DUF5592 family protein n=1 Tax=Carnobacterium maltaromaticum TaxID=2751 RepID=UPI00295EEAD8|nr:DUF5592 family protein [Carnobacterium maltaromaticum]
MGNYNNLRIPRNIKAQIKLYLFFFVDIMIVAGFLLLGYYAQQIFQFTAPVFGVLMVTNLIFGIYLCMKPAACPDKRNFQVILQLLAMDTRKYITQHYSSKE